MKHVCPSCGKPLISGYSPLCNHCGAKISADLLFTEEKKTVIDADELRAKQALEAAEEERKRQTAATRRKLGRPGGDAVTATLSILSHHASERKKNAS